MIDQGPGDDPVTPKGRETKRSLLDAGEAVAAREGLSGLSVGAVTAEAGVAKGTFYVHFADRAAFVESLRARFYAQVEQAVLDAVAKHAPGRDFLLAAIEGYLDVCLAHRAVKALIVEARAGGEAGPPSTDLPRRFESLVGPSMRAVGLAPVAVHTRLLMALASEVAVLEREAGERDAPARAALRAWLPGAEPEPRAEPSISR